MLRFSLSLMIFIMISFVSYHGSCSTSVAIELLRQSCCSRSSWLGSHRIVIWVFGRETGVLLQHAVNGLFDVTHLNVNIIQLAFFPNSLHAVGLPLR